MESFSDGVSASKSETKTGIWPSETETKTENRSSEIKITHSETETLRIPDQDQDLIFNKNPSRGWTSICNFEIIHFLSQNFSGLSGLDRLLWARPRLWEHKTETKIKISRPETETRLRPAKASLETKPGLETSTTGKLITFQMLMDLANMTQNNTTFWPLLLHRTNLFDHIQMQSEIVYCVCSIMYSDNRYPNLEGYDVMWDQKANLQDICLAHKCHLYHGYMVFHLWLS